MDKIFFNEGEMSIGEINSSIKPVCIYEKINLLLSAKTNQICSNPDYLKDTFDPESNELHACYMQIVVKEDETKAIDMFCNMINEAVEKGWIEEKVLCKPFEFSLLDGTKILSIYPATRIKNSVLKTYKFDSLERERERIVELCLCTCKTTYDVSICTKKCETYNK